MNIKNIILSAMALSLSTFAFSLDTTPHFPSHDVINHVIENHAKKNGLVVATAYNGDTTLVGLGKDPTAAAGALTSVISGYKGNNIHFEPGIQEGKSEVTISDRDGNGLAVIKTANASSFAGEMRDTVVQDGAHKSGLSIFGNPNL